MKDDNKTSPELTKAQVPETGTKNVRAQNFIIQQSQIMSGTIKPRHLAATSTLANGDLYYSNGTSFVRLPAGTNGQVLKIVNGVPTWV